MKVHRFIIRINMHSHEVYAGHVPPALTASVRSHPLQIGYWHPWVVLYLQSDFMYFHSPLTKPPCLAYLHFFRNLNHFPSRKSAHFQTADFRRSFEVLFMTVNEYVIFTFQGIIINMMERLGDIFRTHLFLHISISAFFLNYAIIPM